MARILNLPAGYALATFRFTGVPLPRGAVITLGIQHSAVPGTTAASLAAVMKTTFEAVGRPFSTGSGMNATVTWADVLVKFGPLATGSAAVQGVAHAIGAGGGEAYAPNTALLVTKNTSLGGKRGKGRMFVPGLSEGDVANNGIVLAGPLAGFQTSWNAALTQLQSLTLLPMLLHSYDPALGQSPQVPTEVTSFVPQALIATQRQRLRR